MKLDRLKKYWKYKGFKRQADFARALNISSSHITEVDKRKNNRSLVLKLKSIPDFSDLNIEWFETGEGEMLRAPPVVAEELTEFAVTGVIRKIGPEENELLDAWERLDSEGKAVILKTCKLLTGG